MDKKITNKCAEGIINRKGDGKVISIIIEYLYIHGNMLLIYMYVYVRILARK